MKRLIVTRKKRFASAWVPFWIIGASVADAYPRHFQTIDEVQVDMSGHPRPSTHIAWMNQIGVCIKNGETVTIELPDEEDEIYAVTMDGILSNRALLVNGVTVGDVLTYRFTVTTRGGFLRPSNPWFIDEDEE